MQDSPAGARMNLMEGLHRCALGIAAPRPLPRQKSFTSEINKRAYLPGIEMTPLPPKLVRLLADEFHSESWSVSAERAREIAPENPANSSYAKAAALLTDRDFTVRRNIDAPISREVLDETDVLLIVHPCDPRWERTTSPQSPQLSAGEIAAILDWVRAGGGLLVITEYEHDKYGDNLNELLAAACLRIENGKVLDRSACIPGNPEWIYATPCSDTTLGHRADCACFYRASWLTASAPGKVDWAASPQAFPANAGVIGTAQLGKGRIAVVTDSVLFGDEHIEDANHTQLWLNLAHWVAAPAYEHVSTRHAFDSARENPSWERLKGLVSLLRSIQHPDGSIDLPSHSGAGNTVRGMIAEIRHLQPHFPHQQEYLSATCDDLQKWSESGFGRPDFSQSLELLRPERCRQDGLEHLVVLPMYTPNASLNTRFEALLIRTFWPDWLAHLERGSYPNPKFVPLQFVDYTEGYASECAVLFPETVSVAGKASNHFGGIFCDREAARLQVTALRASAATGLKIFPELECLLSNQSLLVSVCALWDLIHDRAHSLGELPFDPFMIRQRSPYWMYGLEELRVDVGAFAEADRLAREGFPFARYVCWAIILDRIFRFPITGTRSRNYDALGGQILFSALHQRDAIIWCDNRLTLHWEALPEAMATLRKELHALYKAGSDHSRVAFWMSAHKLVSSYVSPNLGSTWLSDPWPDESDPKAWLARVNEDEFPLGNFHVNLARRLKR